MTPFPYEALSNDSPRVLARFKTFEHALSFVRSSIAPVRLVNVDRVDGAEDSRCKDGLTEDERHAVEGVSQP